ncbi:Hydrolase, alpha/beta fold family functionally coupled to Phosphoribulokinase [Rhodovulum sp. P5]|uniref:alpha/beta fold hydrolase n=1 Tax=Rhodovulum sp. P5 TaxID=1564506 RepID=UPI0009C38F60|nr:alpha/beta fold hydrolase [Rhodovulum sp. P5]ARE41876.1 Hydrolase, alpha/beta fold family functionally coupled to Phosphoribulokinase [Rhodovulum sp. P5]
MLAETIHGADTGQTPLLIAHGLFGSARNWGVVAKRLSEERQVITVDMRNHGASPWTETHTYADLAADLAEVIDAHGGQLDVLGHSMGGKAAMVLALTHPEKVKRLVVADIAPVGYSHTQAHLIAAMRALDLPKIASRSAADRALAEFIDTPAVRAFLLQSLDLKTTPSSWCLNLDVLEADMDAIIGWPEEIDGVFGGTALFLSGAESDYVRPEHRNRIKGYFPKARFAKLPGADHWLHAEKPREFVAAVATFLA